MDKKTIAKEVAKVEGLTTEQTQAILKLFQKQTLKKQPKKIIKYVREYTDGRPEKKLTDKNLSNILDNMVSSYKDTKKKEAKRKEHLETLKTTGQLQVNKLSIIKVITK